MVKNLILNTCKVIDFTRELNMRNGVLTRSFIAEFEDGDMVKIRQIKVFKYDLVRSRSYQIQCYADKF